MKNLILFVCVFVVFQINTIAQNFTNQSNTSDQSYSVFKTNSPTSSYGNRWDAVWLNSNEMHIRLPKAYLDSTVDKQYAMASTAKFMWVDAITGQIKITPKDSINWLFSQVLTPDLYYSGSDISITGSSPNFTVNNTKPDQIVSLSTVGILNVTGTYPNFTITSTEIDGSVSNELQTISGTGTNTITLSNSGGSVVIKTEEIGVVKHYAGITAPIGYLFCDGSAISRTTYSDLFSICGTIYGPGDGSTTFNLPDLRQRFVLTKSVSGTGNTLGGTGGTIDHTHTVNPPNTTSGVPSATNAAATPLLGSVPTTTHTHDIDIASFNSGTANAPFLVLNSIIKY